MIIGISFEIVIKVILYWNLFIFSFKVPDGMLIDKMQKIS